MSELRKVFVDAWLTVNQPKGGFANVIGLSGRTIGVTENSIVELVLIDESRLFLDGVYGTKVSWQRRAGDHGGHTARDTNDLELVRACALEDDIVLFRVSECTRFLCTSGCERLWEKEDGDGLEVRGSAMCIG